MAIKTIKVELKGISALLMHAFPKEPIEAFEKKTPAEQAEFSAYRDVADGGLYIPALCLQRALISASMYSKGKGRGSLQRNATCLNVSPDYLKLGTKKFEIDTRPVVVPATKGRILRHRPILKQWSVKLICEYDDVLLTEQQVRKIFDDCGLRVGILDFRPEKKGPFGKFMVTSWI